MAHMLPERKNYHIKRCQNTIEELEKQQQDLIKKIGELEKLKKEYQKDLEEYREVV